MRLLILTTGGTIEKTYNEQHGTLKNTDSVLDRILGSLRLPDIQIHHIPVMNKDSLEMDDQDRQIILEAVKTHMAKHDAILILHGTDTLAQTGETLQSALPDIVIPIVLTGAMRPYEFRDTDAMQNVTEALLALRIVKSGVYVVMHNRVLKFPGIVKNYTALHFEKAATS
jgi:L-asparaginase